jgi:hypothetical protein
VLVRLLPEIADRPVVSYFIYVSICSLSITQYSARLYIPCFTRVMHIYKDLFRAHSGGKGRKLSLANSLRGCALSVKHVCKVSSASDNCSEDNVFWIVTRFSLVNNGRRFRRTWSPLFTLKVVTAVSFDKYTRMYFAGNLYFYPNY